MKIKWFNIALLIVLINSVLFFINDFMTITLTMQRMTLLGVLTEILNIFVINRILEHLRKEMK